MQSFSCSKTLCLILMLSIGASPALAINTKDKIPTTTLTRAVGTSVLVTALVTYLRLVTKKTAPKRVYPKDDSIQEQLWYYFDELLVGQIEKGERADRLVIDEESGELVYKYSKIEARGVAGILYSTLKPVIIPALTLLVLLKANTKDAYCGVLNALEFAENPFEFMRKLHVSCSGVDAQTTNTMSAK